MIKRANFACIFALALTNLSYAAEDEASKTLQDYSDYSNDSERELFIAKPARSRREFLTRCGKATACLRRNSGALGVTTTVIACTLILLTGGYFLWLAFDKLNNACSQLEPRCKQAAELIDDIIEPVNSSYIMARQLYQQLQQLLSSCPTASEKMVTQVLKTIFEFKKNCPGPDCVGNPPF